MQKSSAAVTVKDWNLGLYKGKGKHYTPTSNAGVDIFNQSQSVP